MYRKPISQHPDVGPSLRIRLLDKNVYTSHFSTRKPQVCNDHTYDVHASRSLNLIFLFVGRWEGKEEGGRRGKRDVTFCTQV